MTSSKARISGDDQGCVMMFQDCLRKSGSLMLAVAASSIFCIPLLPQNPPASSSVPAGEVTLRIIVVSSPEEAERILDRLKQGQDFALLAKIKSIDSTADDGGLMGKIALSMLRPELRDALQGVGPGQISQVIRIPLGYAILKVVQETAPASRNPNMTMGGNAGTLASGSVKSTLAIGGLSEAELGLNKFDKDPDWNEDPRKICEVRRQSLAAEQMSLENFLSPANQKSRESKLPLDVLSVHFSLGEIYSYQGNMDKAIEQYEDAHQIAESDVPAAVPDMDEALGIAYLHKSEMENDIFRTPGERCILPVRAGSAYAKTGDSEKAVEYFMKYLATAARRTRSEMAAQSHLYDAGRLPGESPARVPDSAICLYIGRGCRTLPRCRSPGRAEVLLRWPVESSSTTSRTTAASTSSRRTAIACEPMHYFHNNGDGTFTDQAAKAGLADQLGGLNIIQTDYNNDGCTDILVLRGAWEVAQRKSLLRNNCDGTFTDVTAESGLGVPTSTQTAVWADINNDGLLDLFVGNENGPSQLFLNKGDGTFEDISHSAGVDRMPFTKGVVAADYDNDGYVGLLRFQPERAATFCTTTTTTAPLPKSPSRLACPGRA